MLTVWSVCNGAKYTAEDVYILAGMVDRNLPVPYRFRCLSDRVIPGIDCLVPAETWPGWWAKLLLFRYATGDNLYLDLDCVVVGPLWPLLSETLSMPANWAQSGFGGCQSSVMSWGRDYSFLPDRFQVGRVDPPQDGNCGRYNGLWGDQEFITRELGNPGAGMVDPMGGIYSYKYHCQEGRPPEDAIVIAFHGEPKPGQVSDEWVMRSRFIQTPV